MKWPLRKSGLGSEDVYDLNMDYSKYDFKDSTELYVYLSKKGLSRGTVEEISKLKGEPDWMRDFRMRSYEVFMSKPMPNWGGDLSKIDFQNIYYYAKAAEKQGKSWDDVPNSVRNTCSWVASSSTNRCSMRCAGIRWRKPRGC